MADVFISYARVDRPIAEALADYLKTQYIDVWWDPHLYAGDDFHDRIREEIGRAKAVIVIWSDAAVASKWVRGEASLADEAAKLVMTHVPGFDTHRLPINFRALHCEPVEARKRLLAALDQRRVRPDAMNAEADDALWRQVAGSGDAKAFELYRWHFPIGRHTEEAAAALNSIKSQGGRAPAATPSPSLQIRMMQAHEGAIRSLAITQDGERIVAASLDGTGSVWELSSGRLLGTLKGHTKGVMGMAISTDGWRAVTGSDDGTAKIWDLDGGRSLMTLAGHKGGVAGVAFTPDGTQVATGGVDYAVRLWDVASGSLRLTIPKRSLFSRQGHNGLIYTIAFANRGRWLITGSADATTKVWQMPYCDLVATLRGHEAPVIDVDVAADGSRLVSASQDGTVRTWEPVTWKAGVCWAVGGNAVTALPNGWGVLVGCSDGQLRVLDAASAEFKADITEVRTSSAAGSEVGSHDRPVCSVAVSADGRRGVSGDSDGKIAVWDLSAFARS